METRQYQNECKDGFNLCVDAYGRLTKRQFISKLKEIDGVSIKATTIFSFRSEFCEFEYDGEAFVIEEDDYDYTYLIKPKAYEFKSLQVLENYFINLDIPLPKTRPAFKFAGIILIGLAVYANFYSS